jgi:hypothetical protein
MKKIVKGIYLVLLIFSSVGAASQTFEGLARELPPYFSVLTTWGLRPEWDETGENIYFLNKMIGDVFRINIRTREISAVTSGFYHGGIYRVLCLANGDLLLAMAPPVFDSQNPEKDRHSGLELFVLKKEDLSKPYSLGVKCDEGPAVSKNELKIAWTLPGQREILAADIVYHNGIPGLIDKRKIISYKDSSAFIRLETQDFRPPDNKELIYTHYWGDETDAFYHAETFGFNLESGNLTNYTKSPGSYDEAEGIFPDGKYTLIESDRHQDTANRLRWKVDVYILNLDGSGEVERLADFSTRYPGKLRSDNPVVDKTGKLIALQYGFLAGAGNGQGIFLFDLEKYKSRNEPSK